MTKFKDYFNSTTTRGRANVAKATYASIAALYLYWRYKVKEKKSMEKPINDAEIVETPKYYEYKNQDKIVNGRHNMHEAVPPLESYTSPCNPEHNPDKNIAIAESIVKSSKTNYESGCNMTPTTPTTTTPQINDEQNFDDI